MEFLIAEAEALYHQHNIEQLGKRSLQKFLSKGLAHG